MVVRIPEKPDFRTGTIAEVSQNIDDKPPNSYCCDYIWLKKTSKSIKKDLNFLDRLDILLELRVICS